MPERDAQRRLFALLRPRWPALVVVFVLVCLGTLLSIAPAFISGWIIDTLVAHADSSRMLQLMAVLMLVLSGSSLLDAIKGMTVARAAEGYGRDLRTLIFDSMLRLPLSFFRERPPGELMNRADADVDSLVGTVVSSVEPTVASLLGMALTIAVMLRADWRLTAVAVCTIPLWALASRPAAKRLSDLRMEMMQARDRVVSLNAETLNHGAASLIKNHGAYEAEVRRFTGAFSRVVDLRLRAVRLGKIVQFVLMTVAGLGPALVLTAGAYLVSHHDTTIGTLVAFLNLQSRLYGPAAQLANLNVQVSIARAVFKRVAEVIALEPERLAGAPHLRPVIEAREVEVSLGGRRILAPTSFRVSAGQRIAVIGASGSGKSTLAAVLAAFLEPSGGDVLIDGLSMRERDITALRSDVMLVAQKPVFFGRSIRDNLDMGQGAGDAALWAAIEAVGAKEMVERCPEGLDTVLDASIKFSGGEQQRLALARGIVSPARVLILDEATSALDEIAERDVLEALETTCADRALIFITHRPERLPRVDRLVKIGTSEALVLDRFLQ